MIIGISGLAGSGKDTAADFLVRKHGFTKVSFGDPLKRACRDMLGFSVDQLWGPSEARNAPDERFPREAHTWTVATGATCICCGVHVNDTKQQCYLTPRYALQQLGTEWGRRCYPNIWIDYALNVAQKLNVDGGYKYSAKLGLRAETAEFGKTSVVIPDIRFKNELEALRKAGAKLIRIVRQDAGLTGSAGAHVSETEQTSIPDELFDSVIFNNKSLDVLDEAVGFLVREWST